MARRDDLDGSLLTPPNGGPVYLVMFGELHWIPNPGTYDNLFTSWDVIVKSTDLPSIDRGFDFSNGALLVRGVGSAPVYLVTGQSRFWVTSPDAMTKYHFNWNKVDVVPDTLVNAIPQGANIS